MASFDARSSALLFGLGDMVGTAVLATEIDPRLLCPGTPSNVLACASFKAALALSSSAALALACAIVMMGFGRNGFGGGAPAMRNDAARDMRGDIVGGKVDATDMDSVRLCPGTSANICRMASLEGGVRGPGERRWTIGGVMRARRSAARVVRGTIVGVTWERGISRALKEGRREELPFVREELPAGEWPLALVVLVLKESGGRVLLGEERWEDEVDRRESVVRAFPSVE